MKKRIFICTLLLSLFSQGADLRVWTSRQGSTITAQLSRVEKESAILITEDQKEIPVKLADLSLADRQHLVEYADQPDTILTSIELGVPEEDVRIDKKQFKRLEKELFFENDSELVFELMESDHFLIATAGKARPNAVAEMAERLWHGMAFQHMNFREDWGDKRMVIFLIEDENLYAALGEFYADFLRENGNEDGANEISQLWDRLTGSGITLPADVREEYNVFDVGRVLRIRDSVSSSFRKVFGPFPTNAISTTLLSKQMGRMSKISPSGYFALRVGHGYYKEIQLAGKSQTTMLSAEDYDGDEIAEARGFADGTSWAKSLKKLVKKDEVKLNLNQMLSWDNASLSPENLVVIYSFSYYMNSSAARVAAYANMIRRIESNNQVPASIEIAKIFGFESVEALEEDWKAFVVSRDFK